MDVEGVSPRPWGRGDRIPFDWMLVDCTTLAEIIDARDSWSSGSVTTTTTTARDGPSPSTTTTTTPADEPVTSTTTTAGAVVPWTTTTTTTPAGKLGPLQCKSKHDGIGDGWCNANCNHVPPHCPGSIC